MYEVEVKVPADLERVRSRLTALEATEVGRVMQADTYYDAPHRSFPETDEALRLRVESRPDETGEETRITYKGPLLDSDSKSREEFETAVGDGETMAAVLANLGFEPVETVRKERDRFALEGYTVTLDAVDGVGEFVEVETEVNREADFESAREGAFDVLERLGLDPDDQRRTSYLELLLES
ncbi:class IV adenylate cyclase [Natrarchaeobaculum sulfurireducens]|uniref:Adenylate cyclase n=1 Tax=Natrarchaeobaculum sulfurireducens TaxID=2044521 RepID=A0A346PFG9_9EURY|nr:class IV adenylate cyclase [Natrarchaeobaculum sulfurireducens]AXR78264.1 Adenylate cyclase, class 2 [Natrarchaeobaculum sulfurireducens]AXR81704.1 Adenylate cyclase [Natrarchaeobaculum sulfurireducens]